MIIALSAQIIRNDILFLPLDKLEIGLSLDLVRFDTEEFQSVRPPGSVKLFPPAIRANILGNECM
jgi:hypothetical protein